MERFPPSEGTNVFSKQRNFSSFQLVYLCHCLVDGGSHDNLRRTLEPAFCNKPESSVTLNLSTKGELGAICQIPGCLKMTGHEIQCDHFQNEIMTWPEATRGLQL